MHVGTGFIFENDDAPSDAEVYRNELRLADLAEPLGFDSIWTTEHHFTSYMVAPNPLQFLSFIAGRTTSVQLGTMITVVPWYDPVRLTEQITMLDTMSDGRVILGIGRGAGRTEYEGLNLDMGESRERFSECAEAVLEALETGVIAYDGLHVKQQPTRIRPAPIKSFKGRTYAAAVSPPSVPLMAGLGAGLLFIPQKPWEEAAKDVAAFDLEYRKQHDGAEPPASVQAGWCVVDEDENRARELAHRYIIRYWEMTMAHYGFREDRWRGVKGYEYYTYMSEALESDQAAKAACEMFMDLQPWGTPEQVYNKIVADSNKIGSGTFVGVFSFGGMPVDRAEQSMRLFADQVMPELKKLPAASERKLVVTTT